jgi:hypothetical protein
MALPELRAKARALRKHGASVRDISNTLHASKSTVALWCRDIPLSQSQLHILLTKRSAGATRGRIIASEKKRAQRIARTRNAESLGRKDIGALSHRDIRILGLGLYWGEGFKNANGEFGIVNSDPRIIRVFIRWVRYYGVSIRDLTTRVTINEIHRERQSEIERYWSRMTGVPHAQFTKTSLIHAQTKKTYDTNSTYYGALRVKVRRGINLQRRVLGSIQAIGSQVD